MRKLLTFDFFMSQQESIFFSVIIPVYNRPKEIDELLESLLVQTYKNFEVIVVEDGSKPDLRCENITNSYSDRLNVKYYFKDNSGQGFARNYGFERAKGDFYVVFDSDCIIPMHYFEATAKGIIENKLDAYGGPDAAHESFTDVQKAISYSMTSFFTTGGIRGKKNHIGDFHPRSFNMGISKAVFDKTQGYIIPFKGEDIEFSIRILKNGFKSGLIENAFVYHKRRTNFGQFFKQLHFFGTARINIFRFFKEELKLVHFFPMCFFLFVVSIPIAALIHPYLGATGLGFLLLFETLNIIDSTIKNKSLKVGLLSGVAAFIQLTAYGIGFIKESLIYLRKG